jgi:hypothetical protein
MLQEIRDTNGNYITYTYNRDNNSLYPYKITYTGKAAARKAHADLIELRSNLEKLVSGKNIPLIKSINEYVEAYAKEPRVAPSVFEDWWRGILDKIQKAIEQANMILEEVGKIRNDFVLEDAYRSIQQALHGRSTILMELRALPAPMENDEVQALAKAGAEYQKLTEATLKASDQIGTYLKSLK